MSKRTIARGRRPSSATAADGAGVPSPGGASGGADEFLRAPSRVPRFTWVICAVVLVGLVVAGLVIRSAPKVIAGSPFFAPTVRPSGSSVPSTTAPTASDVLVRGMSTGELGDNTRLVIEMDIVNTGKVTLDITYPLVVLDPAHRPLPSASAGIYEQVGGLESTPSGVPTYLDRLTRIAPGETAELVVSLRIDCEHLPVAKLRQALPREVIVHVPPAVGPASFDFGEIIASLGPSDVCPTS